MSIVVSFTASSPLGTLSALPDALLSISVANQFCDDADAIAWGRTSTAFLALMKKYKICRKVPLSKIPIALPEYLESLSPLLRLTFQLSGAHDALISTMQRVRMGVPTKVIISEVEAEAEEGLIAQLCALPLSVTHVYVKSSTFNRNAGDRNRNIKQCECRSQQEPEPLPPTHIADIVRGHLPAHIESLIFDLDCRQFDDEKHHVTQILPQWKQWRLPESLRSLQLPSEWYNLGDNINTVQLPQSLTSLKLPNYEKNLSSLNLPSSLRVLSFGDLWLQDANTWPQLPMTLEELQLSWNFPFPIRSIPFPKSLRVLRMVRPYASNNTSTPYCAFKGLSREVWPKSLQELWLPEPTSSSMNSDAAIKLDLSVLPLSLRHLEIPQRIAENVTCSDPNHSLSYLESLRVGATASNSNPFFPASVDGYFQGNQVCNCEIARLVATNAQRQRDQEQREEKNRKLREERAKREAAFAFVKAKSRSKLNSLALASAADDDTTMTAADVELPAGLTQNDIDAVEAEIAVFNSRAAVEPHMPIAYGRTLHHPYDALLFRPSSAEADVKSYVLQVIRSEDAKNTQHWYVWVWWGNPNSYLTYGDYKTTSKTPAEEIKTSGRMYQFATEQEAIHRFHFLFQRKTGVSWEARFDERAWETRVTGQYSLCENRPERDQVQVASGKFRASLAARYVGIPRFLDNPLNELFTWDPFAFQFLRVASKRSSIRSLLFHMRVDPFLWTNLQPQLLHDMSEILASADGFIESFSKSPKKLAYFLSNSAFGTFQSGPNLHDLKNQLEEMLPKPPSMRPRNLGSLGFREAKLSDLDHFRHCLSVLSDLMLLHNLLRGFRSQQISVTSRGVSAIPDVQIVISDDDAFASDDEEPPAEQTFSKRPPPVMQQTADATIDRFRNFEMQFHQEKQEEQERRQLDLIERQRSHYIRTRQAASLTSAGKVVEATSLRNPLILLAAQLPFELRPVNGTLDSILRSAIAKSKEAHQINAQLRRNVQPTPRISYSEDNILSQASAPPNVSRTVPQVKHIFAVHPRTESLASIESTEGSPQKHLLWFAARLSPARLIGILTSGLRNDHGRPVNGFIGKMLLFTSSLADVISIAGPEVDGEESVALLVEVDIGALQDHAFTLGSHCATLLQPSATSSYRMHSAASFAPSEGDVLEDSASPQLHYSGDSITSTVAISSCAYRTVQGPTSTISAHDNNITSTIATSSGAPVLSCGAPSSVNSFGATAFGNPSFGGASSFGGTSALAPTFGSENYFEAPSSFGNKDDDAHFVQTRARDQSIAAAPFGAVPSPTVFALYLIAGSAAASRCKVQCVAWLAASETS